MRAGPPLVLLTLACACRTPAPPAAAPPRATAVAPQAPAYARETIRPGLSIRAIAPEAWVATHDDAHASNVLVVRFRDGSLLLCSSPFDTDTTRALIAWLRARHTPTRLVAINPHWHMDGTAGNAAYREAGVVTYASTHTQALSLERGPGMRPSAAEPFDGALAASIRATAVVPAEHTFDEARGLEIELGGERVRVVYPGAAHSQDNLVVHVPSRGILFGGCMIKVGDSLGYLGDASLATWEPALSVVERLGARIVVPGHGRIGGPELVANTRRLVRLARAASADAGAP